MDHGHANRKPKPLTLDIYSALVGSRPRMGPTPPPTTPVAPPARPWLDETMRKRFGRAATQAAHLLEDARLRLVDLCSTSTSGKRDVRPRRGLDVHLPTPDRSRDRAA